MALSKREYDKQWYEANKERVRTNRRQWRAANRERMREREKERRRQERERRLVEQLEADRLEVLEELLAQDDFLTIESLSIEQQEAQLAQLQCQLDRLFNAKPLTEREKKQLAEGCMEFEVEIRRPGPEPTGKKKRRNRYCELSEEEKQKKRDQAAKWRKEHPVEAAFYKQVFVQQRRMKRLEQKLLASCRSNNNGRLETKSA